MIGIEYYAVVLLVYFFTDLLAVWGLNLEFGVAGVANLAYIVVIAAGAYTYAVLTLGPSSAGGGFQTYIIGASLPFPVALVASMAVGVVVGILIGVTGLRRLRPDYQAMVMLVVSLMAASVVSSDKALVNGNAGLSLIPAPFDLINDPNGPWYYVAVVVVCCGIGFVVMRRLTTGPIGRTLRAMRDDEYAVAAVGRSVMKLRLVVQGVGGALGALSGALLVAFIGGWSPGAWAVVETLALLTAVIVGGRANDLGATVGALVIPILILQGVQFLPHIANHPGLTEDIGWIVLGVMTIVFVWVRPSGIVPERRPRYGSRD
ncbi:MAG: branched-chain amino acid ABC transporter permease [Acidimicrobiaceae bacterium]|nr:branched-chain amino acid ABC transporter permease [Acidimicrobiaceae bacterium]